MTIREAVVENIKQMRAAGHAISVEELRRDELAEFGELEVDWRESKPGRRGRVYTVFHTAEGYIAFWPLAQFGPRIGRYHKRGTSDEASTK